MVKKVALKKGGKETSVKLNSNQKTKKLIPIVVGVLILVFLLVLLLLQLFNTKIGIGDTVKLDYTGSFENGTIFDTSIESIGIQAGLQKSVYQPLTFIVGSNQVIPGFEENVVGMSKGEKKIFTLTPEEGYGESKPNINLSGKRTLNITRYEIIEINSPTYTTLFNQTPKLGDLITAQGISWQLKVVNINDTSIKLENLLTEGEQTSIPGEPWLSTVTKIQDEFITLRRNPALGDLTPVPTQTAILMGRVIAFNSTQFIVEVNPNSPLAGEDLTFEVQIKEITKPSK